MLALLAQLDPTPGWFSVMLQGGSFAVLVYLLIVQMPKQSREASEDRTGERNRFTDELRIQRKDYTDSMSSISQIFKEEATAERAACEKHFSTLASSLSQGNQVTVHAVQTILHQIQTHAERNQQWLEVLKAELAEKQKVREERVR